MAAYEHLMRKKRTPRIVEHQRRVSCPQLLTVLHEKIQMSALYAVLFVQLQL